MAIIHAKFLNVKCVTCLQILCYRDITVTKPWLVSGEYFWIEQQKKMMI